MIKLKNISKEYNGKKNNCKALEDINLDFSVGLYLIYGESGSGKSTMLNIIQGFEEPTNGIIEFDNPNIEFGYVPQNPKLFENYTVKSNLEILGYDNDRIYECLDLVDLKDKTFEKVKVLSSGERQRLCIAQALLKNPDALLLDEPTGNLDESNAINILEILKELAKEKIVILVSHNFELAQNYSDVEIELSKGHIIKNTIKNQTNDINFQNDKSKESVFPLKWRFIYSLNLITSKKISTIISIILFAILFLIVMVFTAMSTFNVKDTVLDYYKKANADYTVLYKEEYSKYLDENYEISKGNAFFSEAINEDQQIFPYKQEMMLVNDTTLFFTLVSVPHDYDFNNIEGNSGIVITDFLARQIYDKEDCIGNELKIDCHNHLITGSVNLKVTGVIKTNYTEKEYQMFKNNYEYKTAHQDEYDYKYSMLFVDEEIYYNTLYGNNVKIQGSLIYNQTVTMKDYLNNSLTYNLYEEANDKILYGNKIESSNEILIGKREYSKLYNGEAFEPRVFSYLDINASPNKNKYEEIFNIYDIKKEVKVVGVVEDKDANNIYISEEFYNDIYKEIHNYDLTGFLVKLPDDNLDKYVSSTLDNGFFLGNSSMYLITLQIKSFVSSFIYALPIFLIIFILFIFINASFLIKMHNKEIVMFRLYKVKKHNIIFPFIIFELFKGLIAFIIALIFFNPVFDAVNSLITSINVAFNYIIIIGSSILVYIFIALIGLITPFIAIYKQNIGLSLKSTN